MEEGEGEWTAKVETRIRQKFLAVGDVEAWVPVYSVTERTDTGSCFGGFVYVYILVDLLKRSVLTLLSSSSSSSSTSASSSSSSSSPSSSPSSSSSSSS